MAAQEAIDAVMKQQKTPVTMLSGYLGTGKTTVLRHLLENSKDKIACVVNDVASVNIDAKLVRNDRARGSDAKSSTKDLADTIELQNGCACCTLQDELFASLEQIIALADKRGEPYARIVLENSGVAEPAGIRDRFNEAEAEGHPLLERLYLDTMVTLVDSSTFTADFATRQALAARPDLGDGGNLRPVVDLLVEQIEVADFVVLNKMDLLEQQGGGQEKKDELVAVISTLNPLATVVPCANGQVPLEQVFGPGSHGSVVARLNVEGQHRGAVAAARAQQEAAKQGPSAACTACEQEEETKHKQHDHCSNGHSHEEKHAHSHENKEHSHDHSHGPACGEEGHTHSEACGHGHKHEHAETPETRAAKRFGIRSFVYSSRRPFHPLRLKEMVLKWLPVSTNQAINGEAPELGDSPIKAVLRSKGFMWMSNSHSTAYYWSHAGQHFEIRDEGDWWAAVAEEDWPEEQEQRNVILADWDHSSGFGDRRQEIVFIGVNMDEAKIVQQVGLQSLLG
uniref:CobW C-terminal domain-containing protein n=1 Tax=Dunaliella tertiolecta TaxID=3047 RepID=A0A7S3R780_DUNTE